MINNIKYANAMTEVLYYLKGIKQEDVDKLPKKFIQYLTENCSEDHICKFDYTKPLKELEVLEETKGLLAIICLKWWCETEEQKNNFLEQLNKNEKLYQEVLNNKYNIENIFCISPKENFDEIKEKTVDLAEYKESIFKKIFIKILNILKKH